MHVEANLAGKVLRATPELGQIPFLSTKSAHTTSASTTATFDRTRDARSPAPSSAASCSSTDRCVICLDAVAEPCVAQPCGHRHYDFLCLLSWLLSRQPSCPLCKATVEAVLYGQDLAKTFSVPNETKDEAAAATGATGATEPVLAPPALSAGAVRRIERPLRQRRSHRAPFSSLPQESPAVALERRRRVYRLGLYARHVGANRHSRCYRELTPRLFAQDPDLVSRARAFLRRELQVFWEGGPRPVTDAIVLETRQGSRRASNVEFLLEYVVAILQTIDLQDSTGQAEKLLDGFFRGRQDHTRHFLHELRSFLRSPYLTLASWDRHVQYGPPGQLFEAEGDETLGESREPAAAESGVESKQRQIIRVAEKRIAETANRLVPWHLAAEKSTVGMIRAESTPD
ncbi:hypothetical protein SEPCBS119000_003596 [Sporothrix epigloea]|uniref:RING-type E3 ubiquitin transferase n=1 Tax=Sporothrix epigloea TaxID=1892477 RepID=A0ABP0DR64_9PEZI